MSVSKPAAPSTPEGSPAINPAGTSSYADSLDQLSRAMNKAVEEIGDDHMLDAYMAADDFAEGHDRLSDNRHVQHLTDADKKLLALASLQKQAQLDRLTKTETYDQTLGKIASGVRSKIDDELAPFGVSTTPVAPKAPRKPVSPTRPSASARPVKPSAPTPSPASPVPAAKPAPKPAPKPTPRLIIHATPPTPAVAPKAPVTAPRPALPVRPPTPSVAKAPEAPVSPKIEVTPKPAKPTTPPVSPEQVPTPAPKAPEPTPEPAPTPAPVSKEDKPTGRVKVAAPPRRRTSQVRREVMKPANWQSSPGIKSIPND